ncbi:hypothetical protein CLAIMM_00763 [Cladophialophora immunda]|nr:hypothetical protein CLAIMM_00763 [Cladophialophora immunda]
MAEFPGKLSGKVALITGGGSGFGAGIVAKFISEGARVVIVDVDETLAQKQAQKYPPGSVVAIGGDVSLEKDWASALNAALATFGVLDVVVNNAGVLHKAQPSTDISEAEYDRIMTINVKQLLWTTKVVVPYFTKHQRPGTFINISSISGLRPRPNLVWYAASKGAVNAATKGLAIEFAKRNLRFNAILPAVGDTSMTPLFLGHDNSPEANERMISSIPLGRLCQPFDVAGAASYLASDDASFLTGVCLEVDGGRGI